MDREFPLFCFAPDIEKADLIQVGLLAVTRAAANFDPSKGAWTTFCYTVTARRLLNLRGQRPRRFTRDQAAGRTSARRPNPRPLLKPRPK